VLDLQVLLQAKEISSTSSGKPHCSSWRWSF